MSEFVLPVRVYYEDTDAGGVVYYANYLKFMERARTEWLRAIGFDQALLREQTGVIFAVRSVAADYLRPARLDDRLEVLARVEEQRPARLRFHQEIRRDGEVLCSGRVTIASVDAATLRPTRIPAALAEKIDEMTHA